MIFASVLMASSKLDLTDPYVIIIAASGILVVSHFYNLFADRTSVPSVLLLIITGILINLGLEKVGIEDLDLMPSLQLLGIVGLIMIVLEAALDLELSKEKLPLIGNSLLIALLCLLLSSAGIAWVLMQFNQVDFTVALLDATPLAIMSSAIIIPSVTGLPGKKREFLVYEGAFSDILGIMMFYFLISLLESGGMAATLQFGGSLLLTIVVAVVASYVLVYVFKDMEGHVRLFLLIAILLMLYSGGKLLHLSPLLIILIFGLSLANHRTAFKVFKAWWTDDQDPVQRIEKEFHLITLETAFVVRTFFFVVFGMTIELSALVDIRVLGISVAILIILYLVRFIFLRSIQGKDILPELWIAPRGLITILLFFAIPAEFMLSDFSNGILLYVIIISSLIMTVALIADKRRGATQSD
ncbi:MAG: cation:proton antiporter [Saprospiraceae bacterium]|nr:cation:proton antiporter [Saprospiraceae bacterium]